MAPVRHLAVERVLDVSTQTVGGAHCVRDANIQAELHGSRVQAAMAFEENWHARRGRCPECLGIQFKRHVDLAETLKHHIGKWEEYKGRKAFRKAIKALHVDDMKATWMSKATT